MEDNQAVIIKKPMSGFERLIKIFTSPAEVFESIEVKPNFLLPIILTVALTALVTFLTKDLLAEYSLQLLLNQGMDRSQAEGALEAAKTITQVGIVAGVIFSFLTPLIKGMVSHLFSIMFSGEGKFGASVSVVLNAYMIVILGMVLSLPIRIMTKNPMFTFSPAVFLPAADMGKPIYTLLATFDIFAIWYLVVSIIGFKKVHKYSTIKAALAILIPFSLILLISFASVIMGKMAGV